MTGVWLIIRFTGIALGIITLLGFASGYLGVEFKPYFKNVLDWLEKHLVDFIVRPEEIEWALDYLRQHFAWVPKPEAHWKPIYTLSSLLMLSIARRLPLYVIPLAVTCALVPAIVSATMPLGSIAIVIWPLAGFCVFLGILGIFRGGERDALRFWFPCAAAFAVGGYYISEQIEATVLFGYLVLTVGLLGLASFVLALQEFKGTLRQFLHDPVVAIGLDITATLGGALFLGWLFAA